MSPVGLFSGLAVKNKPLCRSDDEPKPPCPFTDSEGSRHPSQTPASGPDSTSVTSSNPSLPVVLPPPPSPSSDSVIPAPHLSGSAFSFIVEQRVNETASASPTQSKDRVDQLLDLACSWHTPAEYEVARARILPQITSLLLQQDDTSTSFLQLTETLRLLTIMRDRLSADGRLTRDPFLAIQDRLSELWNCKQQRQELEKKLCACRERETYLVENENFEEAAKVGKELKLLEEQVEETLSEDHVFLKVLGECLHALVKEQASLVMEPHQAFWKGPRVAVLVAESLSSDNEFASCKHLKQLDDMMAQENAKIEASRDTRTRLMNEREVIHKEYEETLNRKKMAENEKSEASAAAVSQLNELKDEMRKAESEVAELRKKLGMAELRMAEIHRDISKCEEDVRSLLSGYAKRDERLEAAEKAASENLCSVERDVMQIESRIEAGETALKDLLSEKELATSTFQTCDSIRAVLPALLQELVSREEANSLHDDVSQLESDHQLTEFEFEQQVERKIDCRKKLNDYQVMLKDIESERLRLRETKLPALLIEKKRAVDKRLFEEAATKVREIKMTEESIISLEQQTEEISARIKASEEVLEMLESNLSKTREKMMDYASSFVAQHVVRSRERLRGHKETACQWEAYLKTLGFIDEKKKAGDILGEILQTLLKLTNEGTEQHDPEASWFKICSIINISPVEIQKKIDATPQKAATN